MVVFRRVSGIIVLFILLFIGIANYILADLNVVQLWSMIKDGQVVPQSGVDETFMGTTNSRTTSEEITRVECLIGKLPEDVGTFGYLPALPRRMEDPESTMSSLRVRGKEYGIYYLTQWALAPRTITFYNSDPWIIANYPDRADGLEAISEIGYSIIEDCGNGVFLLKK